MVWLRAESTPTVMLASSTIQVHELAYRTSPARTEWISRHYCKTVDLETFPVDREMLDRIRHAMARFFAACDDSDGAMQPHTDGSKWCFQPRDDGWFAMFAGEPNDIRAFRRWLSEMLA
jgi:hypothetical protein